MSGETEVVSELVELSENAADDARYFLAQYDENPHLWNPSTDDIARLRALLAEYDALNSEYSEGLTVAYMMAAERINDATRRTLELALNVYKSFDVDEMKRQPDSVQAVWQLGRHVANRVLKKGV